MVSVRHVSIPIDQLSQLTNMYRCMMSTNREERRALLEVYLLLKKILTFQQLFVDNYIPHGNC